MRVNQLNKNLIVKLFSKNFENFNKNLTSSKKIYYIQKELIFFK